MTAAAASVGLLAVWAVRRRRDQATNIRPDSGLLVDVLDTSLEDLRVVPDPRRRRRGRRRGDTGLAIDPI